MCILKALTFVAVAGALAAGSAQAQYPEAGWATGTGWARFAAGSGLVVNGVQVNPYTMQFRDLSPANSVLLPVASTGTFTIPPVDIFCIDLEHYISGAPYQAYFTNLGADRDGIGHSTRSGHLFADYVAAAWLADEIRTNRTVATQGTNTWAIWNIMSHATNVGQAVLDKVSAARAAVQDGSWATAHAYEWVVVTDVKAAGQEGVHNEATYGQQQFLTHVTPEPATLLLLGTGLLTLMAAGVLRRSAV